MPLILEKILPSTEEFNDFWTMFSSLYQKKRVNTFSELADFFCKFKCLEQDSQYKLVEKPDTLPINQPVQYQQFYDEFGSLYHIEKSRGAELNVWQESGLKRNEVRNSAVLAWWLNCHGSHGLGDLLFKALLSTSPSGSKLPPLDSIDNNYRVKVESLPLAERENRIDIEIEGSNFLVFIEVKIDADEGDNQLSRYRELINRKIQVYSLTHHGIVYLTRLQYNGKKEKDCTSLNWKQLSRAFRSAKLPEQARLIKALLMQFCEHIEQF